MVLLSVPDKLIVMTYLCQIRAFCTGQELQLVQLEGGGRAGTYRVASTQPSPPDDLDASGLAQRLREHRAESPEEPKEPKEAASRGEGAAPEEASKDQGAEAAQEARSAEAPAEGPGARASVPVAEALVNGAGAPGAGGGVRLRRSSVNGEAGPVPPPRAHGSFSHVRDADLLKKRRSRLRNSNSFSTDDPDAGATAAVSAAPRGGSWEQRGGSRGASGQSWGGGHPAGLGGHSDQGDLGAGGESARPTGPKATAGKSPGHGRQPRYLLVVSKSWHPVPGIMGSRRKFPEGSRLSALRAALYVAFRVGWAVLPLQVAPGQPVAIAVLQGGGKVSIPKGAMQGLPTPAFSGWGL